MIIRIIPFIIASVLLAAHFFRNGNILLAIICLLLPLLLLVKKQWSWLVSQVAMYLGTLVWLTTTITLIQQRIFLGDGWGRLAAILGGVALFTLAAGLLLNASAVRSRYQS